MNILQRLGNRIGGGVTKREMALVPRWRRHFLSLFDDFEDVVEVAYKKNATVNACMWILQTTFTEPELWAWERGNTIYKYKPLEGHALRKLMLKPNPDMGEVELLQYVITYAPLGGNVYVWKQRDNVRRVQALWPFHDGKVTPIRGRSTAEGMVAYYVLNIGDNEQYNPWGLERFDENPGVAIPKSEMIHWKWQIDPLNPERGMGALVASAGDVKVGNEIRDYIYSFLKNDATPPIVVTMVEGDEVTKDKVERLKALWAETGGGEKRGLPRFLQAGMTVKQLSFNLKDMEYGSLRDGPDTAICNGFHIHPATVGTLAGLKNSTFSNISEANKALALQTLVPLWRSFASEVRQSMAGEAGYAEDVTIRFDLAQVRAMQESQTEIENRLGQMFDRGGILRSEYREALGFEVGPEDEVYKENLASIWVPRGKLREYDPGLLGDEEERQGSGKRGAGGKALLAAEGVGRALLVIRRGLIGKMRVEVDEYFSRLAGEVVVRAGSGKRGAGSGGRGAGERKALGVDDLIGPEDEEALGVVMKRFYAQVLEASWGVWNVSLGVEVAFDLENPLVTALLKEAGERVAGITDVTREALREVLQYGAEQGWSVDELVEGMPEDGIRGIRDVVEETYRGRSRAIARSELGWAQNTATVNRYEDAGVRQVLVLDDGFDNSDENCVYIAGQVRSLAWTQSDHPGEGPSGIKNPLQHPNCVRCFAPYFG